MPPRHFVYSKDLVPGKPVTVEQCAAHFTTELYKKISNQMWFILLASVIAFSDAQVVGIFTPLNGTNPYNSNNYGNRQPPININNRPMGWVNPQANYNPPAAQNFNKNWNISNATQSRSQDTLFGTCTNNNQLLFKTLVTKPTSVWRAFSSVVKEIVFPDINSNHRIREITCIKVTDNSKTKGTSSAITGGGIGAKHVKMRFKSPNGLDIVLQIFGIPENR